MNEIWIVTATVPKTRTQTEFAMLWIHALSLDVLMRPPAIMTKRLVKTTDRVSTLAPRQRCHISGKEQRPGGLELEG